MKMTLNNYIKRHKNCWAPSIKQLRSAVAQATLKSSAVFGLIEDHVLVNPICSFVSYLRHQINGNNPIESVNRENLYILIIKILKYLLYCMVRNHKQAIIHCNTLN